MDRKLRKKCLVLTVSLMSLPTLLWPNFGGTCVSMQFTSVLGRWGIECLGLRVREGEQEGGGEDRVRVLGRTVPSSSCSVCIGALPPLVHCSVWITFAFLQSPNLLVITLSGSAGVVVEENRYGERN